MTKDQAKILLKPLANVPDGTIEWPGGTMIIQSSAGMAPIRAEGGWFIDIEDSPDGRMYSFCPKRQT